MIRSKPRFFVERGLDFLNDVLPSAKPDLDGKQVTLLMQEQLEPMQLRDLPHDGQSQSAAAVAAAGAV